MSVLERIAGRNNLWDEIINLNLFVVKSLVLWQIVVGLLSNYTHTSVWLLVELRGSIVIVKGQLHLVLVIVISGWWFFHVKTQLLPVTWLCCCCGLGGLDNLWKVKKSVGKVAGARHLLMTDVVDLFKAGVTFLFSTSAHCIAGRVKVSRGFLF